MVPLAGPWFGWLKDYVQTEPDPDAPLQFRVRGGPLDAKYQEISKEDVADAKAKGNPVTFIHPIQDGEVVYQQVGDENVLEYVAVRFF